MNLICTYTDISWYLNLTFSHRIWNHMHICNNNLHLLHWCWISLDEIVLWRWHLLHIYLDLKRSHWRWKLSSHCHETIAERYHWWGLVNRQAYNVGESLNQIQLCHLVQSRKLQVEPVICEGWHFTHNCKQLHDPIIPLRGEGLGS